MPLHHWMKEMFKSIVRGGGGGGEFERLQYTFETVVVF